MTNTQHKLNIEHDESRGKPNGSIEETGNRRTQVEVDAHKPDHKAPATRRAEQSKRGA